ncbi:glycoside hydrolase family 1 protein, partial [Thomasclavelia sp.]|uniref:glycoside hydrolase family 1 protein n=1 Tax=Thomasclavelia sp. TaxID=3025757 RepID=UPI0025F9230F
IDLCLKYQIEPIPTLYHFEMPQALVEEFGGWKSRKCIDAFEKYAQICFTRYKDKVRYWITVNEQLIAMAASDLNGNHEPDKKKQMKNMYQMSYHVSIAEKKAFALLHSIAPQAKIGVVNAVQNVYPKTSSPQDVLAAMDGEEMLMYMLLDMSVYGKYSSRVIDILSKTDCLPVIDESDQLLLSNKPDFIGINYYSSICVQENKTNEINYKLPPFFRSQQFEVVDNQYLEKSEWMTNGIDPLGLRTIIYKIYNRYHLPIIITENGMAYSDLLENGEVHDNYRIDYLAKHIKEVLIAKKEGYPIFGYCPWSFIDVLSSHQGFKKRYGLVYVDRSDEDIKECKRYKKDSFYWYQKVINNNGENL